MKIIIPPEFRDKFTEAQTPTSGGFQGFIRRLQSQYDAATGELDLSGDDEAKIRQYAANGQGGWQSFFQALSDLINP